MKKFIVAMALLMMTLSGCRNKAPKILVLYYSQTATTQTVAEEISRRLGADIEAIVAVDPYDGSFQETIERCMKEREAGVLPEIQPLSVDPGDYDVIFLGYPIWFGSYAPPVAALLKTVDLRGKTLVPFCTFGSGGLDSSIRDLKEQLPETEILAGYGVRAARIEAAPQEVERFLKESGFLAGECKPYAAFPEAKAVTEEESALFDAAVDGYPMLHARAKKVSSRPVDGGTEYLFEAENLPSRPGQDAPSQDIRVYVLHLDGQAPVFTQVLR